VRVDTVVFKLEWFLYKKKHIVPTPQPKRRRPVLIVVAREKAQAMPSLRDIAHDGVLCTFRILDQPRPGKVMWQHCNPFRVS
jgi:hypothetical protein